MQFIEWDGEEAFGNSPEVWKSSYPTKGKLLFLVNDNGSLRQVVSVGVEGGNTPITDDNLEATKAAVLASLEPATPAVPVDVPTREEFTAQQESLDWLTNYVISGEV